MKRTLILFSTAFILFAGTGCDKDDDCDLTANNLAGTYKVSSVTYKLTSGSAEENVTSEIFDNCELDDLHVFNANGVYSYEVAGTACSPEVDEYTSAWSLSGSSMTLDGEAGTVTRFDCDDAFSISIEGYDTAGDRITFNFKKQ